LVVNYQVVPAIVRHRSPVSPTGLDRDARPTNVRRKVVGR
jgi:hypothetical protein